MKELGKIFAFGIGVVLIGVAVSAIFGVGALVLKSLELFCNTLSFL